MKYCIFEFPLLSKPRGKVGKHGNIYHNDKEYTAYKKIIRQTWIHFNGINETIEKGYIGLFSMYMTSKGREPDFLDNQLGSILDALCTIDPVKPGMIPPNKIIRDDNRQVLFGDKKLSVKGSRDYNLLLIGNQYEINKIDHIVNSLYNEGMRTGNVINILPSLGK